MSSEFSSFLEVFVNSITFFLDVGAGLIIGISAARALYSFLSIQEQSTKERAITKETIRISLVSGLLLGLDFEVGSDVLKTILLPSPSEVLILGIVVSIRVLLSWSLTRETNSHDAALISRGESPIAGRNRSVRHLSLSDIEEK